ncbi:ATP-binding cassette domain-containing protein [Celerinatantimonas diazotrophica]|uniref:ABC-2 type transport system ATP-binding protein n=1 Tax=Celerinatantimonas diazotrophica TaxID=412034 RepID=A0A4R1K135_9GAMM|nr:ATP-binding cassette domain-containing protein [Celerinatantimonas diazotrophica]TCK57688.1 ABC-2 type transport system ATP-binding protein [Celerinatantimonas diazotrophica]CAG9298250.1 putative multidrug ABC transporter ATP-binding protein YbhF [Celerinatantimonas diazotrophica]
MAAATKVVLQNIVKRFASMSKPALAALNLTIDSGYVTGLIGPDGAGKTTLLRMIAGLMVPSEGSLQVAGFDPGKQAAALHQQLGYMPQKFGLYSDLSVQENLDLYADLRGVDLKTWPQTRQKLLDFTDLGRFTSRAAGNLSGGMKQKLGLACTLVGQPQVLLLDEPGVGVDPISRRELWKMVHELADDGMLIIWSTSYLDEAEQCQRILLMNEGELLFEGVPQKLTDTIQGRSFLVDGGEHPRQRLAQILALNDVRDAVLQGQQIRTITNTPDTSSLLTENLHLASQAIQPTSARFEDAFIDQLGGQENRHSALADILPQIENDHTKAIEAIDLTRRFGDFVATDHVNFAVQRGEIFGLLGPNGAGKSTTFRMMCGLLPVSSGHAKVLGIDLKRSPGKVRQRLGYMAQKFSLYSNLTVWQNLQFFSGAYGLHGKLQRQRINEMVETFQFQSILKQTPESLPLGFKQRLALSCALMHQPDILFLDEPTSGVDPLTRREFWLHINGMVEKGVTVMVTTHFMDEAEYCDRIGLVYQGRLIAVDPPDQLKAEVMQDGEHDLTMEEAFIRLIQAQTEPA